LTISSSAANGFIVFGPQTHFDKPEPFSVDPRSASILASEFSRKCALLAAVDETKAPTVKDMEITLR
jgi:hypothetical protein